MQLKTCSTCKIEKPLDEFHKHRAKKFGVHGVCKSCRKAYSKTPAGRAADARAGAKYSKTPAGKAAHARGRAKYRKSPAGRAVLATPEGRNKRNAINNAIRDGRLIKPDVCVFNDSVCEGQIEGHHHLGYDREHWLDVQWLCAEHHIMLDRTAA